MFSTPFFEIKNRKTTILPYCQLFGEKVIEVFEIQMFVTVFKAFNFIEMININLL